MEQGKFKTTTLVRIGGWTTAELVRQSMFRAKHVFVSLGIGAGFTIILFGLSEKGFAPGLQESSYRLVFYWLSRLAQVLMICRPTI